jgi:phosphohistidine phosphatase
MKTLYFLRHAKAESGTKDISDPERVLSSRGREACALMGAYMKTKVFIPAFVLCSPAARTKETSELIAAAADIKISPRFEDTLYLATAEEILRAVHTVDDDVSSVMVVGHNPGMHHIALLLCEPRHTRLRDTLELKYPTCALSVLRFDSKRWQDIATGEGTLVDFVTPEDL